MSRWHGITDSTTVGGDVHTVTIGTVTTATTIATVIVGAVAAIAGTVTTANHAAHWLVATVPAALIKKAYAPFSKKRSPKAQAAGAMLRAVRRSAARLVLS